MLTIDGRTGEGGGQLVRSAAALAALTGQALRIDNVRGNRPGGGLRPQHVAALTWLADATGATTTGLATGSPQLTLQPKHPAVSGNTITIRAATEAASATLMLQAVLPLLLLSSATATATDEATTTVAIDLHGGTHVPGAPSFDYLDQVLFPVLHDWFGIAVDCTLVQPGWNTGPVAEGHMRVVLHRLPCIVPRLRSLSVSSDAPAIARVDATILAPACVLDTLANSLANTFTSITGLHDAEFRIRRLQDSAHASRLYVLLVATTDVTDTTDASTQPVRRWGCDYLHRGTVGPKTGRGRGRGGQTATAPSSASTIAATCDKIATRVVASLAQSVQRGGCGDVHLQDQVAVFQALAQGETSFASGADSLDSVDSETDSARPFGEGEMHAKTARWVTAQLLPAVRWSHNGTVCHGVGWSR